MTYWPVSVNSSRPNPEKLRLMLAIKPVIVSSWQGQQGHTVIAIFEPKVPGEETTVDACELLKVVFFPTWPVSCNVMADTYDWNTLYRRRQGCHSLSISFARPGSNLLLRLANQASVFAIPRMHVYPRVDELKRTPDPQNRIAVLVHNDGPKWAMGAERLARDGAEYTRLGLCHAIISGM